MFRVALLVGLCACSAAAQRPQVSVLGVAREKLVVEIHNPSDYTISIATFEWTLTAQGQQLEAGSLPLRREILPRGSVVIDLPVSARPSGDYRLDGRLRANGDRATWQVSVTGRFR